MEFRNLAPVLARWDVGGDDQAAIATFSVARLFVNRAAANRISH